MPTRLSAVLAFVFALMLSTGALAQSSHASDNAGGNGSDRSQGQDSGSGSGNGKSGGSGDDSGTDTEISDDGEADSQPTLEAEPESLPEPGSGAKPEVDGTTPGAPVTGGKPTTGPPAAKPPTGSPERQALDAREAGEAVALEDLLPAVRSEGSEVLDAQLLTISGELVYELKVLSPSGTLSTRYFFARTGQPIVRR